MNLRRTAAVATAAALVVALAGYSAWWWFAARGVEDGAALWADQMAAHGVRVAYDRLTVSGWPFRLRADVAAPVIITQNVAWAGERLVADAAPWDPFHIALTLVGTHSLTATPVEGPVAVVIAQRGGSGTLALAGSGQPLAIDLAFHDLRIETPDAPPVPVAAFTLAADRPHMPPVDHKETGLHLTLTAQGVRLPGAEPEGLGPHVGTATVDLRVQGRPPRLDPAEMAAWSADGGVIELDTLHLDWGPMSATASATISLDDNLQPLAAGSAEIQGADDILNAVQNRLSPNQLSAARTILSLLTRPSEGNGDPSIKLPLTIQNRGLYVGPLKVAKIPRLRW